MMPIQTLSHTITLILKNHMFSHSVLENQIQALSKTFTH